MEEENEVSNKIVSILRIIFVYLFLIFLLFLNAANLPMFDMGNIAPYFLLMGIYFWALARPALIPFYLVFFFGLALDFITAQPVGLNAVCFLLVSFILYSQRRFLKGQAWPVIWAGFGLATLLVAGIHLVVFILMNWAWPGSFQLFATVLISVLAYPVVSMPMVAINRLFR